jgi:hypothetical protein
MFVTVMTPVPSATFPARFRGIASLNIAALLLFCFAIDLPG